MRDQKRWKRDVPVLQSPKRTLGVQQTLLDGVQQAWVANYPSATISDTLDRVPYAVAFDASGSVYVTGFAGAYPDYNYVTVKYNASGVQQWVATYIGPVDKDQALAIVVDASSNVYVSGISIRAGSQYGYATIKYSSGGIQQWVARYEPGGGVWDDVSLAVDGAGNVYIAGAHQGQGWDYVAVKYNSSGVQQWSSPATYNGPGNSHDVATGIAVDGTGGVYVTGWSIGINSGLDYVTIKVNPSNGSFLWTSRYNGPVGSDDAATAIAVDGSGNVYVTGSTCASACNTNVPLNNYATVKYNSSGTKLWDVIYDGGSDDNAVSLALDGSGNVAVTGYSWFSITYDYSTLKYSTSGTQQWAQRYNGSGDYDDRPTGVAVNSQGDVFVTGFSVGSTGLLGFATIRYQSATGAQQWVARYDGPGNYQNQAMGLAVDGNGNVYVTGTTYNPMGSIYTTVKYKQIPNLYVNVKVFLQGPYNTTTGKMNNGINTSGILATRFPGVAIPSQAVDSINVEIRNQQSAASSTIMLFRPAWLLADGTIRDFSDTTKNYVRYDTTAGSYYIVVHYRNHLAIMSATAQTISTNPPGNLYDFTTSQSQAFGTNPMKQVGSVFAMISGDVDGNGVLNAADRGTAWNQRGLEGYQASDVDVNGVCNAADRGIIWNNRGSETQVP